MWCEALKPRNSSMICGNKHETAAVRKWLAKWAEKEEGGGGGGRKGERKRRRKGGGGGGGKRGGRRRKGGAEESEDDFIVADTSDSEYEEENEEEEGDTVLLLCGPCGSGKTATVYACAMELGYQVLEVNAAQVCGVEGPIALQSPSTALRRSMRCTLRNAPCPSLSLSLSLSLSDTHPACCCAVPPLHTHTGPFE